MIFNFLKFQVQFILNQGRDFLGVLGSDGHCLGWAVGGVQTRSVPAAVRGPGQQNPSGRAPTRR